MEEKTNISVERIWLKLKATFFSVLHAKCMLTHGFVLPVVQFKMRNMRFDLLTLIQSRQNELDG